MPEISTSLGQVLLIDSDEAFGQTLRKVLNAESGLKQIASVSLANSALESDHFDAILLNLDESTTAEYHNDFRALLHSASDAATQIPVIVYSWNARGPEALEAFREGAFDILEQPMDVQQLKFSLERASRRAQLLRELVDIQKLVGTSRIDGLLGSSKTMERVSELARKVAEVDTTVLITGESGTGKGVLARAIHNLSPRAKKPFVAFSVCAFPESLIEDELFGHERAAFTGASHARRGRFEEANEGTIFLDEIGDLALPLQAKLLRVLHERTLERLGSNLPRPVNVRILCATSRNLEKMVQEGTFREDLYFRISVIRIPVPPLRERKEDIPLLAGHFLRKFAREHRKNSRRFAPGFVAALTNHSWPGNVRELQNAIECSVVLANGHDCLGLEDLPETLRGSVPQPVASPLSVGPFQEALHAFKKELVLSALRMHSGNKLKAAKELGISRAYLHRLLNAFGLAAGEEHSEEGTPPDEEAPKLPSRRPPAIRIA